VARRLIITAIIAICLGGPIVELFDQWDHTLQDSNDAEADVVVAALCVGLAFAVGTIVVSNRIRGLSSMFAGRVIASRFVVHEIVSAVAPLPATSPPTVLRV
jgi:hypothetical protein